jgi:hypothetical protein
MSYQTKKRERQRTEGKMLVAGVCDALYESGTKGEGVIDEDEDGGDDESTDCGHWLVSG